MSKRLVVSVSLEKSFSQKKIKYAKLQKYFLKKLWINPSAFFSFYFLNQKFNQFNFHFRLDFLIIKI